MKEIMAIIRMSNVNATKKTLEKAGFPSLTCRKVLGRGKKAVDYEMSLSGPVLNENGVLNGELVSNVARIGQIHSLMSKRLFTMIVKDEDYKKVIDIFLTVNSHGRAGDGKIFVMDIEDIISVHTLEKGDAAV
ncbi:MAG: P-II family nitrogen regulator [Peptococcaceae bacterium]|jgi:nitrogen regulatory protein PII 2|nr:P-II family nitrogen regulator [Peptococcaceae bacterium]